MTKKCVSLFLYSLPFALIAIFDWRLAVMGWVCLVCIVTMVWIHEYDAANRLAMLECAKKVGGIYEISDAQKMAIFLNAQFWRDGKIDLKGILDNIVPMSGGEFCRNGDLAAIHVGDLIAIVRNDDRCGMDEMRTKNWVYQSKKGNQLFQLLWGDIPICFCNGDDYCALMALLLGETHAPYWLPNPYKDKNPLDPLE